MAWGRKWVGLDPQNFQVFHLFDPFYKLLEEILVRGEVDQVGGNVQVLQAVARRRLEFSFELLQLVFAEIHGADLVQLRKRGEAPYLVALQV